MSKEKYILETQEAGKYTVVYTSGITNLTRTIGYIVKHNSTCFEAERGYINLGFFKSKKLAKQAIIAEFNRPLTKQEADNWTE